jgi:hypothetical protein
MEDKFIPPLKNMGFLYPPYLPLLIIGLGVALAVLIGYALINSGYEANQARADKCPLGFKPQYHMSFPPQMHCVPDK